VPKRENLRETLSSKRDLITLIVFSFLYALIMVPQNYFEIQFWMSRTGDAAQYASGSMGYLLDEWRFPPFHSNLLGAGGLSMSVFDAVPIAGLISKVLNSLLGLGILNYLGIWTFFVFMMQPISTWIALKAWGVDSKSIQIVTIVTISTLPAFTFRMLHSALQAHFLLLLAIALYPMIIKLGNNIRTLLLSTLLLLFTSLTHTYLAVLVALSLGIAYSQYTWNEFKIVRKFKVAWNFLFCISIMSLTLLISFTLQELFTYPSGGGGWSVYSMNALAPFVPSDKLFVEGQYEGTNYMGPIGFLYLLIIIFGLKFFKGPITSSSKKSKRVTSPQLDQKIEVGNLTTFSLLLITFLSLGTLIYFGQNLIFSYQKLESLPIFSQFAESFRAPGRLFWLPSYFIFIVGASQLDNQISHPQKRNRKKLVVQGSSQLKIRPIFNVLVSLLLIIQLISVKPYLFGAYDFMRNQTLSQSFTKEIEPYVKASSDVVVFPEWDCLPPSAKDLVPYIHLAASRNAVKINTTKGSRQKVPYSCIQGDMNERLKRYLSLKKPTSLYFFIGDWARELEIRSTPNLKCSSFFENRYCFSKPRNSN
jgi:hypothetical protein